LLPLDSKLRRSLGGLEAVELLEAATEVHPVDPPAACAGTLVDRFLDEALDPRGAEATGGLILRHVQARGDLVLRGSPVLAARDGAEESQLSFIVHDRDATPLSGRSDHA